MPPSLDAAAGMTTAILLDKWPSNADLAHDLGLSYFTTAAWRRRDSIPPLHWEILVQAARRRRISGVTYIVLRHLAETRPARRQAAATLAKAQNHLVASHRRTMKPKPEIVQGAQAARANTVSPATPPSRQRKSCHAA